MVDQQVTFQQFLKAQRKTNELIQKQIIADQKGDNFLASAKNSAAQIANTIVIGRRNVKEHDETQQAVKDSNKAVQEAIVDQGTIASKQSQKQQAQVLTPLQQVIANQQQGLQSQQKQQMSLIGQFTPQEQREKALLKLNDEQYEDVLKQRQVVERLEDDIAEMKKALTAGTEGSLEFYDKTLRLEAEKKKLAAREQRRGSLGRFEADAAASPIVRGVKIATKQVKDFFTKFKGLLGAALIGALILFVNSDLYEDLRQFVKDVLDGDTGAIAKLVAGLTALGVAFTLLNGPLEVILAALAAFGLIKKVKGAGGGKKPPKQKGPKGKSILGKAGGKVGKLLGVGSLGAGLGSATRTSSAKKPNLTSSLMNTQTNQQQRFKHNTTGRFAKFGKFAKLPGMTTLLGGVLLFNLLTSGASNKEIIKGAGPILGGVLGAVGGAKIGALLGLGPTPLGLLLGLGGSILGALLGEKLGEYMMGFVLGEDVGKMVTSDLGGARDSIVKAFTGPETAEEHEARIAQSMSQLKKAEQVKAKSGFSSITPAKKAQLESNIAESRAAIQKMKPQEPSMEAPIDQTQMRADKISQTSSDASAAQASVNIVTAPQITENPTEQNISLSQTLKQMGSTGLVAHQGSLVSGFA